MIDRETMTMGLNETLLLSSSISESRRSLQNGNGNEEYDDLQDIFFWNWDLDDNESGFDSIGDIIFIIIISAVSGMFWMSYVFFFFVRKFRNEDDTIEPYITWCCAFPMALLLTIVPSYITTYNGYRSGGKKGLFTSVFCTVLVGSMAFYRMFHVCARCVNTNQLPTTLDIDHHHGTPMNTDTTANSTIENTFPRAS